MQKQHRLPRLTANQLRLLAMGLMVLDHLWATIVPGNNWMTHLGRLAFPIFAFQVAEGYCHTSNWRRYLKRLLLFALISEVPFDLITGGMPVYPFHQNVLFTLALGLWAIAALDTFRRERTVRRGLRAALVLAASLLLGIIGMVDYSWQGVATVVAFWALRGRRWEKPGQVAALALLNIVWFRGEMLLLPLPGGGIFELSEQAFAVLAVLPIWMYRGEKGRSARWMQWAAYAFYPGHFLLLWLAVQLLR